MPRPRALYSPPDGESTAIWRYMGFGKFVSMLESQSLYFSRSDRLGDPFEGSLSASVVADHRDLCGDTLDLDWHRMRRKLVFVNCWHMNPGESAGLWSIYGESKEAIAIRSTYGRLAAALDEHCTLAVVRYIDYGEFHGVGDTPIFPFAHKRKVYEHERELRAISLNPMALFDDSPLAVGVRHKVDLGELVESVHLAPSSQPWFQELVTQLCNRYALHVPVIRSSIDALPFA